MAEDETLTPLLTEARALLPQATALRRRLHQHPELGLELPQTRDAVLEALQGLDLDIARSSTTSGFVATLRGARPGPSIVLRADMDALPLTEDTGLEFASREAGRMHACGHDAHTAMLACAARLLAHRREGFDGSIQFMFQPGEEGHFGARFMLEEGLLEANGKPVVAFAIHVDPRLPCGMVASRPGPVLAAADVWHVEVTGKGGHASMPHDAVDPIPVACEIVQALQSFVTRRFDVFDPVVLTTTRIEAGTTVNVIPEQARILGTLRSTSEYARRRAHAGIQRIAEQIAAAHETRAVVQVVSGYPTTVNGAAPARFVQEVTTALLGPSAFIEMPTPVMGAEDFAYVLERIPGAILFLGARLPGDGGAAPCHSNRMVLNEEAMVAGIALHAALALRSLQSHA